MKKSFSLAALALFALVSCQSLKEEWQPVFTFGSNEPADFMPATEESLRANEGMGAITSIADLKALYKNGPVVVTGNVWIKGQVTTSDESGNIYNEIYLQDASGAIDLKLGKSSLHNEYHLGQWVYVKCDGFTLGTYNGMAQLGFAADDTISNEYETSYIGLQALIDSHVFRGVIGEKVRPLVISEDDVKTAISNGTSDPLWGKLVTMEGLTYGNQIFALLYPNPNMAHKSGNPENRVFLSDSGNWGVTTWACTKEKYIQYVRSGAWDAAQVGSGAKRYGPITGRPYDYLDGEVLAKFGADMSLTYKEIMIKYATANYISHFFKLGKTDVQVRTSGYAKFADTQIAKEIVDGQPVRITGIVTVYNGSAQFTLVDSPEFSVVLE